ncbi:extracellular matrix regulator RemB [Desulfosporosinus nitroreducens]|uniref:DUF370 domain-containing protein n=1 Tax=Desulfosporosinus nitroreducens TaxID=2018668 RepID=A0ABT8QRK5_9FIRM|nr:extracellular matrix/biofilm biosynthesis regulator RemA family protein [Desulfosporosinus nitroreducens]MCO1601412.1 DUF370 domain-containing protein [Desulfosporosinus nitroreducens]MDO0823992.1 DUF370 domain-containing protein [Desulfosporosinus nitroreducens]
MYLHLGGDVLIKKDEIVTIIDLDMTKISQTNQVFLDKMKNHYKNIYYISDKGKEKTLIVTIKDLYFSPISSITLFRRSFTEIGNES